MLTRNLHKAYTEVEKLAALLKKDEWEVENLNYDLDWANKKVSLVVNSSINDTIHRLKTYEEEAMLWAGNRMTNFNREPINVSKAEQNKAKTQLKRIQKTIAALEEMLGEVE